MINTDRITPERAADLIAQAARDASDAEPGAGDIRSGAAAGEA